MLKLKESNKKNRADRAQTVALASDLRNVAAARALAGPRGRGADRLLGDAGRPMTIESDLEDSSGLSPGRQRTRPSTVAGVKRRLEDLLDSDGKKDLIRLHIAANDSAEAFNALTARQIDGQAAQALVVNANREVELDLARQTVRARHEEVLIARDRLTLDARLAEQRLALQQEELVIARDRQAVSGKMEGQIDSLNQGFAKLEGTMGKVEGFLSDLLQGSSSKN